MEPELEKELYAIPRARDRIAYIFAANIALNDGDIYKINAGVPNSGKSTHAIIETAKVTRYLIDRWNVDTEKFNLKTDVIYSNELDVEGLVQKDYQHKVIDDAYLQAFNLDNSSTIKYLIKITNTTRNHHHLMEWNFQKPTRSVKGLFERFNAMVFKPNKKWGILMVMSPLMILTSDPWMLNQLIGEKEHISEWNIRNWLKFNPNVITDFYTPKMRPETWKLYNKYKEAGQREYIKTTKLQDTMKKIELKLMDEIYVKIKNDVLTKKDAGEYIMQTYHWSPGQTGKFLTKYDEYERYKKIMEYKKGEELIKLDEGNSEDGE